MDREAMETRQIYKGGGASNSPPEVSIIIPSYQSRRTIGFTLRSIYGQKTRIKFEVIVVDSSIPPVTKWIRTKFPSTLIIHSNDRLLPGAARNVGADSASGAMLAFVDADVELPPDWLEMMLAALKSAPKAKAAGGSLANGNPETVASRLQYWTEFSEFLPGAAKGLRRFLSSSNLIVDRETFQKLEGFSKSLAMSEDLAFFEALNGLAIFEPAAAVTHYHRSRWGSVTRHSRALGYWSGRLRALRTLRGTWLKRIPALSLLLPFYRTLATLHRLFKSDPRQAVAACIHLPLIFLIFCHWAFGFFQGVRLKNLPS